MNLRDNELLQEFRSRQEKLTYYIIALCVTAIGFSVHKTTGKELDLLQIPLGLAVLCWGISIYCGFNFTKKNLNALMMVSSSEATKKEDWDKNQKSASRNIRRQHYLFYTGVVLFILWHISAMYNKSTIVATVFCF